MQRSREARLQKGREAERQRGRQRGRAGGTGHSGASSTRAACLPAQLSTPSDIARLARLARHTPHGLRCILLAFDQRHDKETGAPQPDQSAMTVPNDHVYGLATAQPDIFGWACSVHPYRLDACEELERCHRRGARVCK